MGGKNRRIADFGGNGYGTVGDGYCHRIHHGVNTGVIGIETAMQDVETLHAVLSHQGRQCCLQILERHWHFGICRFKISRGVVCVEGIQIRTGNGLGHNHRGQRGDVGDPGITGQRVKIMPATSVRVGSFDHIRWSQSIDMKCVGTVTGSSGGEFFGGGRRIRQVHRAADGSACCGNTGYHFCGCRRSTCASSSTTTTAGHND